MRFHKTLTSTLALLLLCPDLYCQDEEETTYLEKGALVEPSTEELALFSDSPKNLNAAAANSPVKSSKTCPASPVTCTPCDTNDLAGEDKVIISKVQDLVLVGSPKRILTPKELEQKEGLYVGSEITIPGSYSELAEDIDPLYLNTNDLEGEDKVIISKVRGLVLVGNPEHMLTPTELEQKEGLYVGSEITIPGSYSELAEDLDPLYLNQSLTGKKIRELKKAIQNYFVRHNYPFTVISVPAQRISTGVLQLIVHQTKLDRVVMEGTRHARLNLVKKYISLKPGDSIRSSTIQKDISFINRNTYRHVNAIYAAGQKPYTTDLIINVDERRSMRIYAGADNTGVPSIRRQRLFTGVGINNLMAFDNILNFQYTTSYDPRTFQSYTGQWLLLFPWKNTFNIYGGYSTVRSSLTFPMVNNVGVFIQVAGRYTIPVLISPKYPMEFTFGFDFKKTNTTLLYSELFTNTVSAANLSQFVFETRCSYSNSLMRLELVGDLFYSPYELLGNETPEQYDSLRPGAKPEYLYGKAAARYTQWLPADFELYLAVRGQLSTAPLLPSEQYGLGGFDTVRGYDEYQLNFDNAVNLNFEIRTPDIQIISAIRKMKMKDALQFLAFLDYGTGWNKFPLPGEASPSWLLGAGPGARYTLDPNIALRVDWGWKLKKVPNTPPEGPLRKYSGGPSMVHFSATLSY